MRAFFFLVLLALGILSLGCGQSNQEKPADTNGDVKNDSSPAAPALAPDRVPTVTEVTSSPPLHHGAWRIITAGGENIAPQVIEAELKSIPLIAQAVVIGDRRKYLSALFTFDPERLGTELEAAGSAVRDSSDAQNCDKFRAYFQKQVDQVNTKLARVQTIKRWTVLPEEFTPQTGELTPTMKLKRRVVNERYSAQIEAMYE